MRDAIATARNSRPAVALVTTEFWNQGDFVAKSVGMPTIPRIQIPHPVAGTGRVAMQTVADDIVHRVIAELSGA
ncbi:MAG: hypothetical protein K0U93_08645 [Gammaproteobacteria bacterium]|nr:hypothetical protein [Gammaproteobacteria bacterium]